MLTFEEARERILARVSPLGTETVPLVEAAGRVLAGQVQSPWDLPPWDNSAMDGYAVRADDCRGAATLRITGYMAAGGPDAPKVAPGCAVKIMTGSPVPEGCDAVVPFEDAEERDGTVHIPAKVKPRAHIRFRAEDIPAGALVVPSGTVLRPPEISMLASFGMATVPVFR
jgi:molybdopterin molybdotransferase